MSAPPRRRTPLVALRGITKRFPGVVANRAIDLAIHEGEIHVLLGENGAGKSTLIAILSGMLAPDAGEIRIAGEAARIESPRDALAYGIGTVYQHLTLVPTLTVLENLMLGGPWYRRRDDSGTRARLAALSTTLGIAVEGDARVERLSLGERQQIEIVKALWHGERVLILDEPTSMLTPAGVAELGRMMRRLAARGTAVVFITHKLDEAHAFADRISVLRLGRLVGEIDPDTLARLDRAAAGARIVEMMFGTTAGPEGSEAPPPAPAGAPALELRDLWVVAEPGEPALAEVSLTVREGEVFGIAGVDGNGQKQLAEAIARQRRVLAGEVVLGGRPVTGRSVAARQRLGLRYVTDDRLGEGTIGSLSIALNLLLKWIGEPPYWVAGLTRGRPIEAAARQAMADFDIRAPGPETAVATLSGGNLQKVILARELAVGPRVVVFNKPTYGLDVANAAAIHARIREHAAAGVAALVISTELDELTALCHRIGVISRGRLVGVVENGPGVERAIGEMMIGARAA